MIDHTGNMTCQTIRLYLIHSAFIAAIVMRLIRFIKLAGYSGFWDFLEYVEYIMYVYTIPRITMVLGLLKHIRSFIVFSSRSNAI